MRVTSALAVGLLGSCGGVRDYLPQKAPLSESRQRKWLADRAGPVPQAPPAADAAPIPPLQFFAVYYEQDIVIETESEDWSMHEYARVRVGGRTVWMAKDSDPEGVQTVTASVAHLERWLPEVPVPRRSAPVIVEEQTTQDELDVTLAYQNPKGQMTRVEFRAPRAGKLEAKRNGSTFDHSRRAASVLLDVRRRQQRGVEARVAYDGEPTPVRKVLGLVGVKALLEQIQAGIAAASMRIERDGRALLVTRPAPGTPWPTTSEETWRWDGTHGTGVLLHAGFGVEQELRFEHGGLAGARLSVDGLDEPGLELRMSGPLPDVSRPFDGTVERRFLLSVGGQPHGYGTLQAAWTEGGAKIDVLPEAPYWFQRRPVTATIQRQPDESFRLEARILDVETGTALPIALVAPPRDQPHRSR